MDVPAYTYVVVCMVALSAAAAFGALVLALGQLTPRRSARRPAPLRPLRPMAFEFAAATPAPVPFRAAEIAPAPPAPPVRTPAPPPPPRRRLDLALMSARAPERLRVPVDLARGRILELNLPLLLANPGDDELEGVSVRLTLPNEITYGASLERLARDGVPGLPGTRIRYALAEHETHIRIDLGRLGPGEAATLPTPISIKHAADAAYPIVVVAHAQGMEPLERRYELELVDPAVAAIPLSHEDAWICRPDEGARQRDPHLPLDRIASMRFVIFEPNAPEAPPMARSPEPVYQPLTL